jgi:hypothetical protein
MCLTTEGKIKAINRCSTITVRKCYIHKVKPIRISGVLLYLIHNTICAILCTRYINNFYIFHSVHYDSIVTLWQTTAHTSLNLRYCTYVNSLHVSGLTGLSSSGSAQLYATIIQPFCQPQYVELLQVLQCMIIRTRTCRLLQLLWTYPSLWRHSRTCDISAYWGW